MDNLIAEAEGTSLLLGIELSDLKETLFRVFEEVLYDGGNMELAAKSCFKYCARLKAKHEKQLFQAAQDSVKVVQVTTETCDANSNQSVTMLEGPKAGDQDVFKLDTPNSVAVHLDKTMEQILKLDKIKNEKLVRCSFNVISEMPHDTFLTKKSHVPPGPYDPGD